MADASGGHELLLQHCDCPKAEGDGLELGSFVLHMVLHHIEVVAQQLEDEDGFVLLVPVSLAPACLDHPPQGICGSACNVALA